MLNQPNIDDEVSQIDEINLKIINILKKDSSTPFVDVAKQIGVSDATVHMRVKRMIATGIINKFTISVDNNLLGYDHMAFLGINISPGSADQIISDLLKIEEVLEMHEMHGKFDLLLKIRAKNLTHMRDIVENKVCKIPHILESELMTVLKTEKEEQTVSLDKDIESKTSYV
ncbi:MAG TPA: Lrp/AsnC family transcriptional regulator [Nitrososphaeraceae archaeon]|jgi:Lrp/AsnC family transcriptional regulator for asnA, asnC and gidA